LALIAKPGGIRDEKVGEPREGGKGGGVKEGDSE